MLYNIALVSAIHQHESAIGMPEPPTHLPVLGLNCCMQDLQSLLHHAGSFSCGLWDLVPQAGIKPRSPALGAQSLSQWTARQVPDLVFSYHFSLGSS